jgi:hypothetical protein
MKFLSIYRSKEKNTPPSAAEMETMGKLIEEGFKSGKLLATEGCLPTSFGALVRQAASKAEAIAYVREFLSVVGEGECELRQVFEAGGAMPPCQDQAAKAQA